MSKKNIQKTMQELFGHSCLAYCYAYLHLKTENVHSLTSSVLNGWNNGCIDDDGFVSNPVTYLHIVGEVDVKDIRKVYLDDISNIKEATIVEYKLKPLAPESHFVVVKDGRVVFDPAGDSNTVKNGVPVSIRQLVR